MRVVHFVVLLLLARVNMGFPFESLLVFKDYFPLKMRSKVVSCGELENIDPIAGTFYAPASGASSCDGGAAPTLTVHTTQPFFTRSILR